jgi:cytosine/adenosine deaminase-related metal-dependent hydrolase
VRLSARWVLPIDRPPIEHGAVLVAADGRIAAVGRDADVVSPPGIERIGLPRAALLPGLVNAHTHLELTGFGEPWHDIDFPGWIRRLRARKAERSAADFLAAARRGVADCFAAGMTTVGDTGDSGAVVQALAEAGGSGIAYHEVFGPHPDQLEESMAGLRERIAALRGHETERVRLGVSPHAPYTVSGPLYAAASAWARAEGLPIAVHLAESPEESEFLERAEGAFAEAWMARGIPLPRLPGRTPVAWLDEHGVLGPDTLAIHVVQMTRADVDRLAASGAAVAHCPRSNGRHAHGVAPLERLLASGIRVGVGTDSVASVGELDLLAEARAARALAGLTAGEALALCTLGSADAIGWADRVGSLAPGKWGDCAAIALADSAGDPEEAVLASAPAAVLATWAGGRPVFARPESGVCPVTIDDGVR